MEEWPTLPASRPQRFALWHIEDSRGHFAINRTANGAVPLAPTRAWDEVLLSKRANYSGEVFQVAHVLTLEQVAPGLPPPGN